MAVGVVQNQADEVLISFRDPSLHQGGLWEFPGGKVDPGESVQQALGREFQEELGITPTEFFPFKKIRFQYSDRNVLLDVWRITEYSGVPAGLEGQPIKWKPAAELSFREFPAANKDIVRLLRLPKKIPITPQTRSLPEMLEILAGWAAEDYTLIHCHQPQLDQAMFYQWYLAASALCSNKGLTLFCDIDALPSAQVSEFGGLYAGEETLVGSNRRPCGDDKYFSASCNSLAQLHRAEELGVDFALLFPKIQGTNWGEPGGLGWEEFKALAGAVSLPVYAAGDVLSKEISLAQASGAIGVAGTPLYLAK